VIVDTKLLVEVIKVFSDRLDKVSIDKLVRILTLDEADIFYRMLLK
jgi:hypothetical protein